jgi:hypothetical protein
MIDHIGFPVADCAKSKAFYTQALAPLGYLLMEIPKNEQGAPAAGFGAGRQAGLLDRRRRRAAQGGAHRHRLQ